MRVLDLIDPNRNIRVFLCQMDHMDNYAAQK